MDARSGRPGPGDSYVGGAATERLYDLAVGALQSSTLLRRSTRTFAKWICSVRCVIIQRALAGTERKGRKQAVGGGRWLGITSSVVRSGG